MNTRELAKLIDDVGLDAYRNLSETEKRDGPYADTPTSFTCDGGYLNLEIEDDQALIIRIQDPDLKYRAQEVELNRDDALMVAKAIVCLAERMRWRW